MKSITFRERQVLRCLAEGLTSSQTAKKLYLSIDTIKTYRARLMLKLDAKNAFQLGMCYAELKANEKEMAQLKVI